MTISQISLAFKKCQKEKRPALLTYTVAGDNSKKKSFDILNSISNYADLCELGFPHNTPLADGGQIQTSSYRAIKNGIKMKDVFQIVKKFKKKHKTKPIILMGYYNMIYQYGEINFIKKCKQVCVSGLIVVDLPWPENKSFARKCKKNSITFVQLLSPTTSKTRMKRIIKDSHNLLYIISMISTTGGKLKISPKKIIKNFNAVKKISKSKNLILGFGITSKNISSFKKIDGGVVVGSEICKKITESIKKRENPTKNTLIMVKNLKRKLYR